MESANLGYAKVRYTNFTGTDLSKAITTHTEWNWTTCPDGTKSDQQGHTCVGHLKP
jgi:uncharacterized protein YjbI with pentapeptide repeats